MLSKVSKIGSVNKWLQGQPKLLELGLRRIFLGFSQDFAENLLRYKSYLCYYPTVTSLGPTHLQGLHERDVLEENKKKTRWGWAKLRTAWAGSLLVS